MKEIEDCTELEVGAWYHFINKRTGLYSGLNRFDVSVHIPPRGFFGDENSVDFWAYPENNQAMEHFRIFGPVIKDYPYTLEELRIISSSESHHYHCYVGEQAKKIKHLDREIEVLRWYINDDTVKKADQLLRDEYLDKLAEMPEEERTIFLNGQFKPSEEES